ncbi:MAG: hypothetical protein GY953_34945, partial [bacterium]|nr:hypothetical protein [bacterium]
MNRQTQRSEHASPESSADGRLDSWKEIAAYLKRGVRTVQRWEHSEGLPVHRHVHSKLGSVYAYRPELDAWWNNSRPRLQLATDDAPSGGRRVKLVLSAAVVCVVAAISLAVILRPRTDPPQAQLLALPLTTYPGSEIEPTVSPDGAMVAFSWDGDARSNYDIYVKATGGGRLVRLTDHPARNYSPAWSADGRQIAFLREEPDGKASLLVTPALGGSIRKLGETLAPPLPEIWTASPFLTWSPDSRWIVYAYSGSRGEPYGLRLLPVNGGEERTLTSPPPRSVGDTGPAFAPDGRALVFSRHVTLTGSELFLLELDENLAPQREPRQLTFEEQQSDSPVWTPDGREIIYSSGPPGNNSLWKVAASESGRPERLASVGEDGRYPSLSREGHLVYTRQYFDTNIWRLDLSASLPVKLISSTRRDQNPQYSPDGRSIAFGSTRSGHFEVWVSDNDGTNARQLTAFEGPLTGTPRWSPDGSRIAFDSRAGGSSNIYLMSSEGGPSERLTTSAADDMMPSWSRDGRWVYFGSNRTGDSQLWKIPVDGGTAVQVTRQGGAFGFESP